MINIIDKHHCCGCTACAERCPNHCIVMIEDAEGFLYPKVDDNLCVECGLCETTCPVINQPNPRKPIHIYAAKNPDESIRLKSSSGGVFTSLAEQTLMHGGVVFGAKFDANWVVVHDYTETIEGLEAFRKSKYVQSFLGTCFKQVETFLKEGREVLFTGTPCQVAGLLSFLKKDYTNLITIDIVCHGVPSPMIWKNYLNNLSSSQLITDIQFRYKEGSGLSRYLIVKQNKKYLCKEQGASNLYIQGFLNNLYLRPSCYQCPAKSGKSGSDLTIADFWGIEKVEPSFADNKGVSLVLVNSNRMLSYLEQIPIKKILSDYDKALLYNGAIEKSVTQTRYIEQFWSLYPRKGIKTISIVLRKISIDSLINRTRCYLKKIGI